MAQTLQGLTTAPAQDFSHTIDEGLIQFALRYRVRTKSWYLDVEFDDFVVRGLRVVNSPNMLDQYRNVIPFGVLIAVRDGFEPFLVNDFSEGRVTLNVLSRAEVAAIGDLYMAGNG